MKAKKLSDSETDTLIGVLKNRFEKNMHLHKGMEWSRVEELLRANPSKLNALKQMEDTGGEPDVVFMKNKKGTVIFFDCAAETPKGRRSICYDQAALNARKENKPKNSALHMAETMGIEILTEGEYRQLQELAPFDLKTSSWIATPESVRKLGGALFCDRRYDTVFTYHNGAESYYAARGFRGKLEV